MTLQCAQRCATPWRVRIVTTAEWTQLGESADPRLSADERATALRTGAITRFDAKPGQVLVVPSTGDRGLLLVGRAASGSPTSTLRGAAAVAAQSIADGVDWSLELPLPSDVAHAESAIVAAAEGVLLSRHRVRKAGGEAASKEPGRCTLVADIAPAAAEQALARARALVAGMTLTRDLVNAPAAELGPSELADAAVDLARRHGYAVECWRAGDVARRGFRMVAAVGRGSARPPTVTVLRRGDARAPELALIGKGVVFDSGGLDLKSADAMLLMRKDMAGAATVLGALESAARLKVERPLLVIVPSAENMVGPDCYRPGDVLRAFDGTTVEIGNTDAEGRLLLADAMGYAREQKAERLIDFATLTGAARVALGPDVPALFSNDDSLARLVERAAAAGDEPVWRMPLVDAYERQLETPFADVNHVSHDRRAGAITAALFLRRFAAATPWAHVDFYGWEENGRPETPKGANGMGVRTLVGILETLAQ